MKKLNLHNSFFEIDDKNNPTISQVIDNFLIAKEAEGVSERTLTAYAYALRKFEKFLLSIRGGVTTIYDVTANAIQKYLIEMSKTCEPVTCHHSYRIIRTLTYWFEEMSDGQYISPVHKMRAPKLSQKKKTVTSIEELSKLIKNCDGTNERRNKAILLLAFDSGLRVAEISALNVEDVNLLTGRIEVLKGKGAKFRITFVGHTTLKHLRLYLRERRHPEPYEPLFTSNHNTRLSLHSMQSMIRRLRIKAGIEKCSFHALRRGFGTEFIRNEGNPYILQQLYGHSDITTTLGYLGLNEKDLEVNYKKSNPLDRIH